MYSARIPHCIRWCSRTTVVALLLAVALSPAAFAQETVTLLGGRTVKLRPATRAFAESKAEALVSQIVAAAVLDQNFRVLAVEDGSINAAAELDATGSVRLILYSPKFLQDLDRGGLGRWSATGVLAHEIGHHLNGHTLGNARIGADSAKAQELSADRFAGAQLAKLGATEAEAIAMLDSLSERDTPTHPGRARRVAAVRAGWCLGAARRQVSFAPAGGSSGCVAPRAVRASAVDYNFALGAAGNEIREREYPEYRTRYMLGGLALVQKEATDSVLVAIAPAVLPNVADIEATAFIDGRDTSGTAWGIAFGADSTLSSGFAFVISVDGTWGLLRKVSGDWEELHEAKEPVPAIRKGLRATNTIAVRINRGSVTLVVNDLVLDTIEVGFMPPGRVALVAEPRPQWTTVVFRSLRATAR